MEKKRVIEFLVVFVIFILVLTFMRIVLFGSLTSYAVSDDGSSLSKYTIIFFIAVMGLFVGRLIFKWFRMNEFKGKHDRGLIKLDEDDILNDEGDDTIF